MLTWPAHQSCGRHRALQLGGGGEGVGEAPHPHGRDAMGQLALGALRGGGGGVKGRRGRSSCCFASKRLHLAVKYANLLDGVMLDHVCSSAGLVVVEGGRASLSLSLLQLLGHQLLRFQRRGRRAAVGDGRGRLLVDAPLDFLLLLQRLDEGAFQPVGVLRFQGLFLIGGHALFTKHEPAFGLVLPPAAGKVSVALGADEGLSGRGLGQSYTCLP